MTIKIYVSYMMYMGGDDFWGINDQFLSPCLGGCIKIY